MNCSLNPLACLFRPTPLSPLPTILIPSAIAGARFLAPPGHLRVSGSNIIEAESVLDVQYPGAEQMPIEDLPSEVLRFLLPSRYCEVDQFGAIAHSQFGSTKPGWERAVAIRDWVHDKVTFNYNAARPTTTATDVFIERTRVCRDFQHLAITLTLCMNIPARYVTGHIGDIPQPFSGPGDFSAWYQVFLDGRWIDLDARLGRRTSRSDEMSGWVELGDGMAGFAVGLFLHAVPASWWPRWLGKLVGKVR
jgi:transglutaminase-like putative cysteine protease